MFQNRLLISDPNKLVKTGTTIKAIDKIELLLRYKIANPCEIQANKYMIGHRLVALFESEFEISNWKQLINQHERIFIFIHSFILLFLRASFIYQFTISVKLNSTIFQPVLPTLPVCVKSW